MREPPPPSLAELLDRLGVADEQALGRLAGDVRRLAGDLPRFESIWIDAAIRAGLLTRWQGREIAEGQGERLAVGPYLLEMPMGGCLFAQGFRARHRTDGTPARLIVLPNSDLPEAGHLASGPVWRPARPLLERLEELVQASRPLIDDDPHPGLMPLSAAGAETDRLWVSTAWPDGRPASEWLIRTNRLPGHVVLHIAREMTAALAHLERHGLVHGDVSTSSVILRPDGGVVLAEPGLRGVVRPEEGYGHDDLSPEAYDSVPPERIEQGSPPDASGDRYASALVWWHLLCGRSPLEGGDGLSRLRSAHRAKIPPLAEFGVDVPAVLAETIEQCLRKCPADRPESFAAMSARLGPPTTGGRQTLARLLARHDRAAGLGAAGSFGASVAPGQVRRHIRGHGRLAVGAAAAVAIVVALTAGFWPEADPDAASGTDPNASLARAAPGSDAPTGSSPTGSSLPTVPPSPAPRADTSAAVEHERLPSTTDQPAAADAGDNLLPSDRPITLTGLRPRPGERVGPPPGERAVVRVPRTGLLIGVPRGDGSASRPARIEDVDFVFDHAPTSDAALLRVRAEAISFERCTFRLGGNSAAGVSNESPSDGTSLSTAAGRPGLLPPALAWMAPREESADPLALPSGWMRLSSCRFEGVSAAVECRHDGAVRLECDNVLHLGPGPLLRTPDAPRPDAPMVVDLRRVTLRHGQALWHCLSADVNRQAGSVWIRAERCVFAPSSSGSLLLLDAENPPEGLLRGVRWTGQGSLVTSDTEIVGWRRPDGTVQAMDDSRVAMAGLVRGRVEFAGGERDSSPAANRLVDYQAPIQSADTGEGTASEDAPGAIIDRLPK